MPNPAIRKPKSLPNDSIFYARTQRILNKCPLNAMLVLSINAWIKELFAQCQNMPYTASARQQKSKQGKVIKFLIKPPSCFAHLQPHHQHHHHHLAPFRPRLSVPARPALIYSLPHRPHPSACSTRVPRYFPPVPETVSRPSRSTPLPRPALQSRFQRQCWCRRPSRLRR